MRLLALLLCLFWIYSASGQQLWISDETSDISTVDLVDLPERDNLKLYASARSASDKGRPRVFALPVDLALGVAKDGTWESTQSGRMVWRQRIRSKGAYSLNMAFTNFQLPKSAVLFLYDINKNHVIGPITAEDNEIHNEWWSPVVPYDEVVIEVQVDQDEYKSLDFYIHQVNHDFSGFGALLSGSCNIDVLCSEEDGFGLIDDFRDIIQSVGLFILEGFQLCSGFLINNTRNDCTPYFLTAYHCDVSPTNAASVVVYWNYQNSSCRMPGSVASGNPGDGSFEQFNSGSSVVAGDENLDFRLLLLDDEVDPETQPFFAGWDVESEVFDTTICIHHPNGDEKRISIDYDPPTVFAQEKFVRVEDWDIGTTEEGSSGAPLFSSDQYAIGLLSEGLASCQNDLLDDFASIKLAWEGAGAPQARLKDWLDPDNTGVKILEGKNCARSIVASPSSFLICAEVNRRDTIEINIKSGFEDGAGLALINQSEHLLVTLSADSIFPGQLVEVFFQIDEEFNDSLALVTILATSGSDQSAVDVRLSYEYQLPEVPMILSPSLKIELVETDVLFQWQSTGANYDVELYTDTLSEPVLSILAVEDAEVAVANLSPASTYYWRVNAQNICGSSGFGNFEQFSILNIVCQNFISDHDPIEIPEVVATVESQISVSALPGKITDVNIIDVRGRHTYLRDLQIQVMSPSGTIVDLVVNPCFDEDNFFASFDDESEANILDCPFDEGKSYQPSGSLSNFDGENPNGSWSLIIDDQVNMDGGSLLSWGLEICLDQRGVRFIQFSPSSLIYCKKDEMPVVFSGILSENFADSVMVKTMDVLGNEIPSFVNPEVLNGLDTFEVAIDPSVSLLDLESLLITTSAGSDRDTFAIPVSRESGPSVALLQLPENEATEVDRETSFNWMVNDDTDDVRFRLFADAGASLLLVDTIIRPTQLTLPFKLEKETTYYWQVSTIGVCADTDSDLFSFTTEMSVAAEDQSLSAPYVFPNPASQELHIAQTNKRNLALDMYDLAGRKVLSARLDHKEERIDISILSPGLYFVELIINNSRFVSKVVIDR